MRVTHPRVTHPRVDQKQPYPWQMRLDHGCNSGLAHARMVQSRKDARPPRASAWHCDSDMVYFRRSGHYESSSADWILVFARADALPDEVEGNRAMVWCGMIRWYEPRFGLCESLNHPERDLDLGSCWNADLRFHFLLLDIVLFPIPDEARP